MRNDPYQQIIDLLIACGLYQAGGGDQQGVPVLPLPAQIAALQGTDTEDAEGLPTDIGGLRSLVRVILGQPQVPTGAWPMSLSRSATRLNLLEPRVALLEQLVQQYAAGATATSAAVQLLTDRLSLLAATQTASDARQAADEVRLAAVEAKATLTASATEANRLDIVALKAADVLLQTRATNDEAAIAAAQASATQARSEASRAQQKADDDAAALLALQTQLSAVQATASAAQAAAAANATALAGKLDAASVQRFTTPTPALTVAVGVAATFNVVLPKAFATNQYLVFFTKASGAALLNVQLSDTAKLPGSFSGTMQQTGLASLAVAASSAEVLAILIS